MLSTFCFLEEKNKTRADGFGHKTDRLQKRNDPEQQVQQKSEDVRKLSLLWQSRVLSPSKDNSQNTSVSELPKTDSTSVNQLQNVSGWPQDHRLKKKLTG